MKKSLWESLVRTALLGTARAPLSEALQQEAAALSLSVGEEPVQTVLELLAAARVARKAAFPLVQRSAPVPTPERPEQGTLHQAILAPWLDRILSGGYPRLLDEWLDWLAQHPAAPGLPPEFLPLLLDRAARDAAFFQKIRPALGARGGWLAQQNPAWNALYVAAEDDWATGAIDERLRWLRNTRETNPLLALAALEKTWPTERKAYKGLFLATFRIRLSTLDEDFLEKILATDREVQKAALHLLLQMTHGRRQQELAAFFRARIAGIFTASSPTRFLEKNLPGLDEQPIASYVTLLSPDEVKNWRIGLVTWIVRLLPPSEIAAATRLSPRQLLVWAAEQPDLPGIFQALVKAAVAFQEADWLEAVALFVEQDPSADVIQSTPLALVLHALPAERGAAVLVRLLQHDNLLRPGSTLVPALQLARRPWPRDLLLAFLGRLLRQPFPQPLLRELLENAAYLCRPEDAEGARHWLWPDSPGRHPWQTELAQFYEVVHFRRQLQQAWAEAEKIFPPS